MVGNIYCTSDISNPTPVYVVQGGEAILQCGFENNFLSWRVYNGGSVDLIAAGGDITDNSKYNVSKNPSTKLYYRLHILNVGVSDVKKYRCSGSGNGVIQNFYLQLIIIGRCYYILVIFTWKTEVLLLWVIYKNNLLVVIIICNYCYIILIAQSL